MIKLATTLCVLTALLSGCTQLQNNPLIKDTVQKTVGAGVTYAKYSGLSDSDEKRMAQKNAEEFEKKAKLNEDPLLNDYLTQMTQRIVKVTKPRDFPYRIKVVNDPNVNAFTFGGGLVYVNAGLLARMENEAQLAMVVAHEIAHVTESHVTKGIKSQIAMQMAGQLAATAAASAGVISPGVVQAAYKYSMSAAINGHGRARESEADELGLEYMVKAGYDPREAPITFELLLKEYGDPSPLVAFFYASHPTNVKRIENINKLNQEKYANVAADQKLTVNTEEFKRRTRSVVVKVGTLDYEKERFNTAKAMFEKAILVSQDDPVPYYYLGKIALETSAETTAADVAIKHFNRALKADQNFVPVYAELGKAYYRKGDRVNAAKAFERYVILAPDAKDANEIKISIKELKAY